MNFAKLKKSTIAKTITTITLSISLIFCNVIPAFAATAVDQESLYPILRNSSVQYLYPVTGTTKTIPRLSNIADILAMYADQSTLNQKTTYTYLSGTIKGYIDGIETGLDNVNNKLTSISGYIDGVETSLTNINTNLTNIKGYVDGLEGYVDNLETYVDNVETLLTTNNTRLNDIKTAIQNISTYNYTSILTDIQTNMLHVPTIDQYVQSIQDSIGYGNSIDNVLTNLNSVNGHLGQIFSSMSYWDDSSASSTGIAESVYKTYKTLLDMNTVGNHTFKVLSFGGTQYTPDNANRSISIVDNSPTVMGYIGYRANNTGGYSLYSSNVNTMGNRLSIMNNNLLQLFTAVYSANTFYRFGVPNYTNGTITGLRSYSLMDSISGLQHQASQFFARMGFVLADDDTIDAKNANKAQEQEVLSSFTGSGTASASASDFGDIASGLNDVKSGINTNVSITNALDVFDSSDGFGWFSNTTLNNLNTVQSTRNRKSANEYSYYNERLNAIYDAMGVKHD